MAAFSYRTIQYSATGSYKEKGSRFLAFAYSVESEIKERLVSLRKEYFDARHHCYAWMIGADKKAFRAVDDGEPNHSAGDPILGQIRSKDLTNILIVVIRYFGGVKLGVGGLSAAYKISAEDALNNATIVEKDVMDIVQLTYGYLNTPEIMRLVKEFSLAIIDQQFDTSSRLKLEVRLRDKEKLIEKLTHLKAVGAEVTFSFKA